MPRETIIYDIFLSSPGDVVEERKFIVQTAQEWNSLHSQSRGCFINVLTWEDVVAPALRDRPQSAINDQIGDTYDAYLGLMWSRFGSSTGVAESGTVEEFERALERFRSGENVHVAMLFKTTDIPTAILDGQQFDKVRSFRQRYSDEGGMYRTFTDLESLRILVNRIFESVVAGAGALAVAQSSQIAEVSDESAEGAYGEIGLIEWNQRLSEFANVQAAFLSGWADRMQRNTAITNDSVGLMEDMAKVGGVDPVAVNNIMRRMADSLDEITDFLNTGIEDYIINDDEIINLVSIGFDLFKDFPDESNKLDFRESLEELLRVSGESERSSNSLLETINGIPRLSQIFNKSRNKFIRSQTKLSGEFSRFSQALSSGLDRID